MEIAGSSGKNWKPWKFFPELEKIGKNGKIFRPAKKRGGPALPNFSSAGKFW